MADVLEIVTRWGDTVIDVAHVDASASFRLGAQPLVERGELVAPAHGQLGHVAYAITRVARPPRSLPYTRGDDHRVLRYVLLSLAAHLVLWSVASEHPPLTPPSEASMTRRPTRIRATVTHAPGALWDEDGAAEAADDPSGTPMALEGDADRAAAPRPSGLGQVARRTGPAEITRIEAIEQAQRAGILSSLDALGGSGIAALAGTADLAGGLDGTATQPGGDREAPGFGSLLGGGAGLGATCDAVGCNSGTIGVGRYGTGLAAADSSHGTGRLRGRASRVPTVVLCGPRPGGCVISGDLDKAIIRRYLRRAMPQITYCYEKELLAKPTLTGTVTAQFLIGADGRVAASQASGGDEAVAACIAGVISRIEFPRSRTGTSTRVNYPFHIRWAGS